MSTSPKVLIQSYSGVTVTSLDTQTPVIPVESRRKSHLMGLAAMTVKFLRCGCPTVQLVITYDEHVSWDTIFQSDVAKKSIAEAFKSLQGSFSERFILTFVDGILLVNRKTNS